MHGAPTGRYISVRRRAASAAEIAARPAERSTCKKERGIAMDWLTTSTVLHELRDFGNRAAWERFAERFRRPIVSFARTLGLSTIDAEDVAQETLLAFAESYRRGQYDRSKGRLSRWLFGIAYRQALNERRSGARAAVRGAGGTDTDALFQNLPDEAAATVSWDYEWEQALLQQCLEQVRSEVEPITYQAFELVVRGERSPTQAAAELGVPIKLVYNAKHRVLKRIRELRAALDDV